MLVVVVVVLLVFGPNRLPEIARSMGKFLRNFQQETTRALDDLKQGIEPQRAGIFDEPDADVTGEATPPFGSAAEMSAASTAAKTRSAARRKSSTPSKVRRKPASKTRGSASAQKPAAKRPAPKRPAPRRPASKHPAAGRSSKKK